MSNRVIVRMGGIFVKIAVNVVDYKRRGPLRSPRSLYRSGMNCARLVELHERIDDVVLLVGSQLRIHRQRQYLFRREL